MKTTGYQTSKSDFRHSGDRHRIGYMVSYKVDLDFHTEWLGNNGIVGKQNVPPGYGSWKGAFNVST